jgi:CRP-like cAMP-binding protein
VLKSAVFSGLSDSEAQKMMTCLGAKEEKFNITETIVSYNGNSEDIGVVLSGTAELVTYDYDGNRMILERYDKNSVFGQLFAPFSGIDEPAVIAAENCEVMFFKYRKVISQCVNACESHTIFLDNMLCLLTEKLRAQANHIEVLSKRSLRGKLMAFFEIQAREKQLSSFTLPFSLYTLADYLSIDRSAMQREMKKMREEGLIKSKGKKIELCKKI